MEQTEHNHGSTDRLLTPELIRASQSAMEDAFRQQRQYILDHAGRLDHTDKEDGSPVTAADIEVEERIKAAMASRFPDIPVYGEEAGYDDDAVPDVFWLVDPIDGTKSFLQNLPAFTSMAVLISSGRAVASNIYNISTDDMFAAREGEGAYKNGNRLDLRAVPLPHLAHCKKGFIDMLNGILELKGVKCENGPEGGGYGFTLVADGLSAARFNLLSRGYTHDYAPGALLIREAGGVILPVQENQYTYTTRSFIACHPELEPVLRPHLPEIRALELDAKGKKG